MHKRILIMTMSLLLCSCNINKSQIVNTTTAIQFTADEETLLKETFINQKVMADYKVNFILQYRAGLDYLKTKYPLVRFTVLSASPATKYDEEAIFYLKDNMSASTYELHVTLKDDEYHFKDNYYTPYVSQTISDYFKDELLQNEINVTEVYATCSKNLGRDFTINMSVEDIISKSNVIEPIVNIFIKDESLVKEVQELLLSIDCCGNYYIYVTDIDNGDDCIVAMLAGDLNNYSTLQIRRYYEETKSSNLSINTDL